MSEADKIWEDLENWYTRWGLNEIPFSESAPIQNPQQLYEVFTGREIELREVLNLVRGRERKRILIYGWVGIGKTALMLEVLGILERKAKDTLPAYISLPPETDLASAALIALARAMKDDELAQHFLAQLGLISGGLTGKENEIIPITSSPIPTISFENLLERAFSKYKNVVIGIDDLDKQDPDHARQLLHDAQGLLKGGACFILTGHPSCLTRDILISERGLFDLCLKLEEMDQSTTYRMLVNYLNSVRSENSRYDHHDPKAVHPFTQEVAHTLCERSGGVPRWLNRLGCYVLLKATELRADIITHEVLQKGIEYTDQRLRGQLGLTPEDDYVLNFVLDKGILSDNTTLTDLQHLGYMEFSELLPILNKLIQMDLVRRLPTEHIAEYEPTPMLLWKHEKIGHLKASKLVGMPKPKPSRTSAFISYSHKDKKYIEELYTHLAHYIRAENLNVWDDTKIQPGARWREEIEKALQSAKVAILLLSADFLASDFIAKNELPPLLVAAKEEGAIILCVILRTSAFKDTKLAQFQAVNIPSKPLSTMTRGKRDEIWNKVAELVRDSLKL